MATIAVFLAIGGGAYAAAKIDGSQIKKNSLPANRLEKKAVVPMAKSVQSLHLSSSRRKGGHKRVALAAGDATGSLVQIPDGSQATILESPPFTVSASCDYTRSNENDGTKWYRITETATSSVDGWNASVDTDLHSAGQKIEILSFEIPDVDHTGAESGMTSPWLAVPAQGKAVTLSSPSFIAHNGVCTFNQFAIG
jgi:hypothetical protein